MPDTSSGSIGSRRGSILSPTRVLFLAVDAGDWDLIRGWSDEGWLPTFRSLRETSAWGVTSNPTGLFVGAVWPSFWTGLSPARHGRYCFEQIRTGSYDLYPVTPRDTTGVPFWDTLSDAGRRVAVIDVPKTYPSSRIRGLQIVDWGTHDPDLGFSTSPAALAGEIAESVGAHPIRQCDAYLKAGAGGLIELRDGLLRGIRTKVTMAEHFLDRGNWDLFLTVFAESHCIGHQCWHVHDPSHPRHDPALARALGDPIRDVYIEIDAALGRLLGRAGPEATVIVLASHGMGPHYDATFLLDEILRRIFAPPHVPSTRKRLAKFAEAAWHRVPERLYGALWSLRDRVKRGLGDAVSRPDSASTFCFPAPNNDVYGGIRVNLVGREPQGRVQPKDLDVFCERLSSDLRSFVNLDTGEPLVRRVLRTAEIFSGERLGDLPDLLVEWERNAPVFRIESPRTGRIEGAFAGQRTGDHKATGVFFARGPGIEPGRFPSPVSILQFAPTIAARLGVRLPDVDADPVSEIAGPPTRELYPA
jgi:predicted AlkP superfamily phosphohydrolase/phosphomutase